MTLICPLNYDRLGYPDVFDGQVSANAEFQHTNTGKAPIFHNSNCNYMTFICIFSLFLVRNLCNSLAAHLSQRILNQLKTHLPLYIFPHGKYPTATCEPNEKKNPKRRQFVETRRCSFVRVVVFYLV